MARVLFLVNHEIVIYNFRLELVEKLLHDGHEVHISSPAGEKVELLKQLGCHHHKVDIDRHSKNVFNEIKIFFHYYRIIKEIKPDIVFTYTIKPNIYGGLVCRLHKVPYISNITGLGKTFNEDNFLRKIIIFMYKASLKKAQKVFFQNQANYDIFAKYGIVSNKYGILPGSGVNLERNSYEAYPSDENGIVFITIGRIMKDKGIDELLETAREVRKTHPEVVFQLLGYFDDEYGDIIKVAEKEHIVEFIGYRMNVHDYIKASHATIHPSYHEGMANVILESAATGRPVIATDIPGCKEAVEDKKTGLLCRPKDSSDLKRAVFQFLSISNKDREEMGKRGREKMEREFDRNIVVQAYMDELSKVVSP